MTIDSQSKSYIVLVVMKIYNSAKPEKTLYREDIVLQQADNLEVARTLVIRSALEEQASYKNSDGEDISVEFIKIQDISEISQTMNLYSRHFRDIRLYEELNRID